MVANQDCFLPRVFVVHTFCLLSTKMKPLFSSKVFQTKGYIFCGIQYTLFVALHYFSLVAIFAILPSFEFRVEINRLHTRKINVQMIDLLGRAVPNHCLFTLVFREGRKRSKKGRDSFFWLECSKILWLQSNANLAREECTRAFPITFAIKVIKLLFFS